MVDADIRTGDDLPHSIAYTINGEPGDLCDCSKGTFVEFFFFFFLFEKVHLQSLDLREKQLGQTNCYI